MIAIDSIDHLVLTVNDIATSCAFYQRVLGMDVVTFANGRKALSFGKHKINLHQVGHEFEPKAERPTLGSADLCLLTSIPLSQVMAHFVMHNVEIIEGPVTRTGATGAIVSVYIRDPDLNLIEIANEKDG